MNDNRDHIADVADELETEFGDRWGVWRSSTGRWWAARRDALSAAELGAGCTPFLRADDLTELASQIEAQEDLCHSVGSRTSQVKRAVRAQRCPVGRVED